MSERRKIKRRHLIYYLRVFNHATNQLIGHLVDITTKGMMLLSEDPIPTERTFHFRMKLPREIHSKAQIQFHATSIWCKKDVNPDFYATGFSLEKVSTQDVDIINRLISDYGFRD